MSGETKGINISRLREKNKEFFNLYWSYKRVFWDHFPYDILEKIMYIRKPSQDPATFNDMIIMADTETSKKPKGEENHVCAWSLAIRAYDQNIVTLWGRRPSDLVQCMERIMEHARGDRTIIYFHNLGYDWQFLRRFLIKKFAIPVKQLNVKPYLPIYIEFENGLILRDSLIVSGCSLEKWADELDITHKKAVGSWDYDKIRHQSVGLFTPDEMLYIENDVLAGVECIQKLKDALGKKIYNMPWTMTGIVREGMRKAGAENGAHDWFKKIAPTWEQLKKLEKVYHGGFTHGNRHYYGYVIRTSEGWKHVKAYDFASSYPFVLLTEKYPSEAFKPEENLTPEEILECADEYAYMFKLILVKPELRSDKLPMPPISLSKCTKVINPIIDNGRIIQADYLEIYSNEVDLQQIVNCYRYVKEFSICTKVEFSKKDYLPRWMTDFIYSLFFEKTRLKSTGAEQIYYSLAKSRLNACYGLTVQHPCKPDIVEEYFLDPNFDLFHETIESQDEDFMRDKYQKYLDNRKSILPYFIGVWCTSYAMKNLFLLGSCIDYKNGGEWLYSDTDSIYCTGMDEDLLAEYNRNVKQILTDRGYPAVRIPGDDREYWLGVAEHEGDNDTYSEFCFVGAKRYVGRCVKDNKLHVTVAGVPKLGHGKDENDQFMDKKGNILIGAKCLNDDIDNFKTGFIFKGILTGKKTHKHFLVEDIYIDEWGNETGDSIDLSPCDYKLKAAEDPDWDPFAPVEVEVQMYEDD